IPSTGNSEGRNHPYKADKTQRQAQTTAHGTGPKHNFWTKKEQVPTPANFDWLVHLDRPLTSPIELFYVSAFKPHELTQEYKNPRGNLRPFNHRVPWYDEDLWVAGPPPVSHRLYRFFEFVQTRSRMAGLEAPLRLSRDDIQV